VERCLLFCNGDTIGLEDLPPEFRASSPLPLAPAPPLSDTGSDLDPDELADSVEEGGLKEAVREATARIERELILRALKQMGNNVTHTARLLKISRKSLQTKMKELGLREES
jgi:DNA-binding NtrC family response regulator